MQLYGSLLHLGNLLVIGGDNGVGPRFPGLRPPIELIDVSSSGGASSRCNHNIPPYPEKDLGEAIVLLQGKIPVICGGHNTKTDKWLGDHGDKYCYHLVGGQWTRGPNLSYGRKNPTAFALNDTAWMVAGGVTTEILSLDGSSRQGPRLPMLYPKTIRRGCSVKINDTTAIAIGKGDTYYYSIDEEEWSQGPSFGSVHQTPSCGLLEDLADPSIKYIILTGHETDVTKILQVGTEEWVRGPDFPNKVRWAGHRLSATWGIHMTPTPDGKSLVVSGGNAGSVGAGTYQKYLYRIQCPDGIRSCKWEKLPMEMKYARNWHTSVFLPESEYPCHAY